MPQSTIEDSLSSALSTALATDDIPVPTEFQHINDLLSTEQQNPQQQPPSDLPEYEGLIWSKTKFRVPQDDRDLDSWVWKHKHGWRVWDKDKKEHWLCKICHKRRSHTKHWFKSFKSTTQANNHMKEVHRIDKNGPMPVSPKSSKKRTFDQYINGYDAVSAVENTAAASFNMLSFRALLLQWMISDNIPFIKVESRQFRQLIEYLNPRARAPVHTTVIRWIEQAYDQQLGILTEALASAATKVSLSFDLWTSDNRRALLGVVAHFISEEGKPMTVLLSLPRQYGKHSGANIAESVAAIIAQYNIADKLGYFITDNASNNKTCLEHLADEFAFNYKQRWIRCSGHILNLIAQQILFGQDADALELELEATQQEEQQQLLLWRKKGPCGKLHNIVKYINRSPQRIGQFEDCQRRLIAPTREAGKAEVYKLVEDNDTRWNSMGNCIERAIYLRPAIDEFIEKELDNYHAALRRNKNAQQPSVIEDALSQEDWEVLTLYHNILQPIKEATSILQGQIGGPYGAIWQVLPQLEGLLEHLETQRQRHLPVESQQASQPSQQPHRSSARKKRTQQQSLTQQTDNDEEPQSQVQSQPQSQAESSDSDKPSARTVYLTAQHHFSTNINAGWQKLNEYYKRLDDTIIYVAAVVLHPRMKWRYLNSKWTDREDWLLEWKTQFEKHWKIYKAMAPPAPATARDNKKDKHAADEWSDGEDGPEDQLEQYLLEPPDRSLSSADSPVDYWLARRKCWPQLAAMALDVYSVPAMADEPERLFSQIGDVLSPRRRRITSAHTAFLMCLKSWHKSGLITLDKSLFERAIQATITTT